MSEVQNEQERPCLHCMMLDLIDDFFAEYPTAPGKWILVKWIVIAH